MRGVRKPGFLALLAALAALAGCSSTQVASQKDPTADLASYRTFDWSPAQDTAPVPNAILDQQIRYSLQSDLSQIGVQRAQPGTKPDLSVSYGISVQNIATRGGGVGLGVGVGVLPGVGVGVSAPVGEQTQITQRGTLAVTFVDPIQQREVWRGTASANLDGSDRDRETIQNVINDMMGKFKDAREREG